MDSERFRNISMSRELTASVFVGLAGSCTRKGSLGAAQKLRDLAQHVRQLNHDDYSSIISKADVSDLSIADLELL